MIKIQVLILRGFCQKRGENLRAMLKCGRMELNVTLSQQLKKVFFAFLSNTHTEIQLGIEDLM